MAIESGYQIDFVGDLLRDFSSARKDGAIYSFCGEASPYVYSNPDFLEAARDAKRTRGVVLHVLTSPIILEDEQGTNGLLTLAEEDVVKLYPRVVRGVDAHFRVTETDGGLKYWVEEPHSPLQPLEERRLDSHPLAFSMGAGDGAPFLLNVFRGWTEHSGMLSETVYLTSKEGLRQLVMQAEQQKEGFNCIQPAQLLNLPDAQTLLRPYSPRGKN